MPEALSPALLDAIRSIVREEVTAAAVPVELVDADGVARMLTQSKATIYRMNDAGQLPRPVEIDLRGLRWRVREIQAWIAADQPPRVKWETIRGTELRRAG